METKNIVVVGGSGFIGTRLVARLLGAGHTVRIADKKKSEAYPALWTYCDIRKPDTLAPALDGAEILYHLAAEHRDDVRPISLYDDVNVEGTRNLCHAADQLEIRTIIFTSSVAIYGFPESPLTEEAPARPFNDYGRTKWEAEGVLREWQTKDSNKTLTLVRPTVVFGEQNRGNVYNLFRQIAKGPFVMIGDGMNKKSMAYVENVAGFLEFAIGFSQGVHVYNYVDKPDFNMNTLVDIITEAIGDKHGTRIRIPYAPALILSTAFDLLAFILRRPLPISRIRIKKFCSCTQFSGEKVLSSGYKPSVLLTDAVERTIVFEFNT